MARTPAADAPVAALLFLSLRGLFGECEAESLLDSPLFDISTILLQSHLHQRTGISLIYDPHLGLIEIHIVFNYI